MSEPPTGTAKRAFNSPLELGLRMLFLLEAAGEGARICSGWWLTIICSSTQPMCPTGRRAYTLRSPIGAASFW